MMRYLIAVSVILAAAGACGVAEAPDESTASPTDAVVEASGMVPLAAADGEKRFILRHPSAPERWNGRLVITAHGGTGGPALAADGTQVGTSETSLDDVVGAYAVEQGFAYASVDRDGIGGTTQGLAVVSEFAEIARERLGQAMGRPPAQVYLVGLSMGGGIARLASEAAETPFDGIVIIAGAGGDAVRGLDRLARRAALWPAIDPHEHPEVDDDDPAVAAYAADGAGDACRRPPALAVHGCIVVVGGSEQVVGAIRPERLVRGGAGGILRRALRGARGILPKGSGRRHHRSGWRADDRGRPA